MPRTPRKQNRRTDRAALRQALQLTRGTRRLFVIEAAVEVGSQQELKQLMAEISRLLCPVSPELNHRCARRWALVSHPVEDHEARAWRRLLNQQ